jgi:hypothetical protein
VLVIDDTALPKKGEPAAGVARQYCQYCGYLGKRANCQVLVSLTLAQGEVPIPVGLRLFLPEQWTADPERCARAGVPEAEVEARNKGEIALAELDRLLEAGLRFGLVLADAGYGASAAFRHGLDARQLPWAVGLPRTQFEGRSCTGLHRHALMTSIAFGYLQHLCLRAARGRGKSADCSEPAGHHRSPACPRAPRDYRPPVRASRRVRPMSALWKPVPTAA